MKDNLIILSGGMDSITLLHEYRKDIATAISFYYGQKHSKEINFAIKNCKKLDIKHLIIDISNLLPYLKSNLLITGDNIPEGHYQDKIMKKTVVPFRNGVMLSIACAVAESMNLKYVMIANHAGDHAIYPDCREDFIKAMNDAMKKGTYANIQIKAPYTNLTKRDIALIGQKLGIDYGNDTWSCYKGEDIHCGKCGTCIERKEALQGFDNTIYKN